ncbi:hypothetical protein CEXT_6551 [Caerostris extrusa]|uniref:Uncharacterized protein n=1 Tax=Caerostris extrusa TaxID=172846 RepID=A0AAV4PD32_CAEEX|nr:hypothetical protein CEXT_6551 [Caerostris extrusa]
MSLRSTAGGEKRLVRSKSGRLSDVYCFAFTLSAFSVLLATQFSPWHQGNSSLYMIRGRPRRGCLMLPVLRWMIEWMTIIMMNISILHHQSGWLLGGFPVFFYLVSKCRTVTPKCCRGNQFTPFHTCREVPHDPFDRFIAIDDCPERGISESMKHLVIEDSIIGSGRKS